MNKKDIKKVVLAYSGGLDTSIIIPWLKENYNNPEIIAVSGNVGQASELEGLEEKALKTGASKLIIADLVDEMCDEIIVPSVMMDAKYEKYLLGTAFARPVIGKKLAEIALAEGADAIAHGATGKGNDQVRFELAIKRFAPDMAIIAPWREWEIKSRDEEIDYAEAHHVPLKISRETNYSKDKNLWHLSHEGLDLEKPSLEPQYNKPGFLEKFGLGYEDVKKVNPGIVYGALTPFGYKPNKYSDKPSYDICAVAMSGLNAQTGERDGNPTRIGSVIGDMIGAEGFFAALMLALFHKQRTGEGQFVDFSLVRNLVHINDTLQYHNKKGHIQYRSGNHNSNMSPYGIYTGKTMSIVIGAVAPSTWNPLCDCMNRPDLKTDPDFATLPMRSKNHEKVEQIITDWLMTFDDTREAYEMMEKAGVAVAPVMTAEEVWEDEEYNRLGWWVNFPMYPEWEGTDIISNKHCAYFADFSTIDEHPENRPANISTRIGENNYEVLKEWGKTEEEAKALLEKWGAINI